MLAAADDRADINSFGVRVTEAASKLIRRTDMKRNSRQIVWIGTILLMASRLAFAADGTEGKEPAHDKVIAIDVLLKPDAAMINYSQSINKQLRENYPSGYTLGRDQVAHITLVHRYVREKDLPAIEEAVAKLAAIAKPLDWKLTASGCRYGVWAGVALTTIDLDRTPELQQFHEDVVKAVQPFAVPAGDASAFSTTKELPKIDSDIVDYVAKFVPNSSGEKFYPHITVGAARENFVKRLKAKPFEKITFQPARVSIYQLGNFGTAQKKLWQWPAK